MKDRFAAPSSLALLACALAGCSPQRQPTSVNAESTTGERLEIARAGSQPPTEGSAENFTGSVVVAPLFQFTEHRRAAGAYVTFAPGARAAWHTHPAGQTLIVTSGTGWVQAWGGQKQEIRPGDVIWTPPGVKHWHGATATSAMTHMALQEHVDGGVVEWMEQVSDEEYQR